jgi:hypothetical protein
MPFTVTLDAEVTKSTTVGRSVLFDISDVQENIKEEAKLTVELDTGTVDQQIGGPLLTGARILIIKTDWKIQVKLNVNTQAPAWPVEKSLILWAGSGISIDTLFLSNSSGNRATVEIYMAA